MNTNMWNHPATGRTLEMLRGDGVFVVEPGAGELACGVYGSGRMADPESIVAEVKLRLQVERKTDLRGLHVVITAGGTREPIDAVRPMKPSNSIRIMIEPRCQPEPESPFSIDALAAASSRCIGCGSNSAAKAIISSRVTWRGPNVPKWPGVKSSKVSGVIYLESGLRIAAGKPECGRYLRQSQPVHPHGLFATGERRLRRSPLTCPKQFSGLALCGLEPGF